MCQINTYYCYILTSPTINADIRVSKVKINQQSHFKLSHSLVKVSLTMRKSTQKTQYSPWDIINTPNNNRTLTGNDHKKSSNSAPSILPYCLKHSTFIRQTLIMAECFLLLLLSVFFCFCSKHSSDVTIP